MGSKRLISEVRRNRELMQRQLSLKSYDIMPTCPPYLTATPKWKAWYCEHFHDMESGKRQYFPANTFLLENKTNRTYVHILFIRSILPKISSMQMNWPFFKVHTLKCSFVFPCSEWAAKTTRKYFFQNLWLIISNFSRKLQMTLFWYALWLLFNPMDKKLKPKAYL